MFATDRSPFSSGPRGQPARSAAEPAYWCHVAGVGFSVCRAVRVAATCSATTTRLLNAFVPGRRVPRPTVDTLACTGARSRPVPPSPHRPMDITCTRQRNPSRSGSRRHSALPSDLNISGMRNCDPQRVPSSATIRPARPCSWPSPWACHLGRSQSNCSATSRSRTSAFPPNWQGWVSSTSRSGPSIWRRT